MDFTYTIHFLFMSQVQHPNEKYLFDSTLSIQALLNNWHAFSEKIPKGFGKYFDEKEGKSKKSEGDKREEQEKESTLPKENEKDRRPREEKIDIEFELKNLFFKERAKSTGGGAGRPIGGGDDNDREKLFSAAMLAGALLFGGIAYYSYAYKEINWKDFTGSVP